MTRRKADIVDDQPERIEREAIDWIKRTPTEHWVTMARSWLQWWPALSLTAQKRILSTILRQAIERGDSWPAELVQHVARRLQEHLKVGEQPRSRIRNTAALRKAAEYRAHHPEASWNELANAAGVDQATVRQWAQMPEFARYETDARFLLELDDERLKKLRQEFALRRQPTNKGRGR
jgi:hypothetical protein